MAYRIQVSIDDDLEQALRAIVKAVPAGPQQRLWDELTPQEKNEFSCVAIRNNPKEIDTWLVEHNMKPVQKSVRSLNALIIGLLNQHARYTPEELAEMMDNSGVRPAGRPPL